MKLSDFKGLFKKSIVEVDSVENPFGDYYTVKMKPVGDGWIPGEHGIFSLPGKQIEGKKWRAFSVASVPSEGYFMIGTRTGKEPSSFKKQLIGMKKGDKVQVRGPFGWFKVQDSSTPIVLFASGVGITPVRALLKQLAKETSRGIHVIHAASDYHLFEDDLKDIAGSNDQISLHLTKEKEETQAKLKELASRFGNDAYYYVSGNGKVISSTKDLLINVNVKGNRIINDPFLGY